VNDRTEFNKKCEEILNFIDIYGVIRCCQLDKFFLGSKKNIEYLLKNKRLYKSSDGVYISTSVEMCPDKAMVAALGVLSDIMDKVKTHSKAEAPAQISFLTCNGEYYEILYVAYGMESMTIAAYELHQKTEAYTDTIKRIVIVEDKSQMDKLRILGAVRFALIETDGRLSYYKI